MYLSVKKSFNHEFTRRNSSKLREPLKIVLFTKRTLQKELAYAKQYGGTYGMEYQSVL